MAKHRTLVFFLLVLRAAPQQEATVPPSLLVEHPLYQSSLCSYQAWPKEPQAVTVRFVMRKRQPRLGLKRSKTLAFYFFFFCFWIRQKEQTHHVIALIFLFFYI